MGRRKKPVRRKAEYRRRWSNANVQDDAKIIRHLHAPHVSRELSEIVSTAIAQAVEDNLPSPIDSPRLGAGKSLQSIARGEEIPQLRAKNFIFSAKAENQAAYQRIYKQDRYRGLSAYHQVLLDDYSSEHFKYWLLFKETRWCIMIDNTRDKIKSVSIVYGSREHCMFVLQHDRVVWHQRLDGPDYDKDVEV